MSAMMARQGGRVQLEQSDMCVALNMAKMAKAGFSHTAIVKTQYLIKKPRAEVREAKKRGVQFPGHNKVKAAMERHPAMLRQNHTPGCHSCQHGTAKKLQSTWRHNGTGAPPSNHRRQQTPELTPEPTRELMPPMPGTRPTSTGNTSGAQRLEVINLSAGYAYSHVSLTCAESFSHDTSAQDSEHDTDFDPDKPPDKGTCTG